jgi:hypothetical protein
MTVFVRTAMILVLTVLSSRMVAAQSATSIFAPFVTRLNAEVSGRAVRLKWVDSPSVKGPVYVYRSRVPFSGTGAQYQARGLEVPYGQQTFVEEVEALGMWYYFVAASDDSRTKYELVVAYNNIIDVQLDGTAKNIPASPGMTAVDTTPYVNRPLASYPAQQAAEDPTWDSAFSSYGVASQGGYAWRSDGISGIAAQSMPNGVYVSFSSSDRSKNVLLYRSNAPFTQRNDILAASLVKDYATSPYIDYPPQGYSYYYAVLYEEDIRSGQAVIYPGGNATTTPVQYGGSGAGAAVISGGSSYAPLSSQQNNYLEPGVGYFSTLKSPSPLTAESAQAVESLRNRLGAAPVVPKNNPVASREPRVFNQDIQNNATSGEDYDLAMIVRGPFFRKDWGIARVELERYLSVSRSPNVVVRARFYLGQCHYFMGNAREAVNEFMSVHSLFPDEAEGWVQAALAKTATR